MRGTSNEIFAAARQQLPSILATDPSKGLQTGETLFGIADKASASPSLLAELADPAATGATRATALQRLLNNRVSPQLADFLRELVMQRWAANEDLVTALEELGRTAVLASAAQNGTLDQVEDELVSFTDTLQHADDQVQEFLSEPSTDPRERMQLVDKLLKNRVNSTTLLLARRAALEPGGHYLDSLQNIATNIATHRQREIAHVVSAVELTPEQTQRLEQLLARKYGHDIQVYVSIDPSIVGGLRIEVGADVIDDTVITRMAQARAALVA